MKMKMTQCPHCFENLDIEVRAYCDACDCEQNHFMDGFEECEKPAASPWHKTAEEPWPKKWKHVFLVGRPGAEIDAEVVWYANGRHLYMTENGIDTIDPSVWPYWAEINPPEGEG